MSFTGETFSLRLLLTWPQVFPWKIWVLRLPTQFVWNFLRPERTSNGWRGEVVYIDSFR